MDIGVISVRYARALLKGSCDAGIEDKVYADMQSLARSYIEVPLLRPTIDNPTVKLGDKLALLMSAAGSKPTGLTTAFLSLVLKEGRERFLQFMANSYITLYRKYKNIIRGKLTTATAVSAETENRLRQMVESKTNGTVEFETEVDPDLIGGFVLEYDTYRMDASVKTKLNAILSQLKM